MYKYLIALLFALTSLVAVAHEHGDHGDKTSDEKTEVEVDKEADKETEDKAAAPAQNLYEDPKKYYPKK